VLLLLSSEIRCWYNGGHDTLSLISVISESGPLDAVYQSSGWLNDTPSPTCAVNQVVSSKELHSVTRSCRHRAERQTAQTHSGYCVCSLRGGTHAAVCDSQSVGDDLSWSSTLDHPPHCSADRSASSINVWFDYIPEYWSFTRDDNRVVLLTGAAYYVYTHSAARNYSVLLSAQHYIMCM